MQTIHKFPLGSKNNVPVEVSMPVGAFVLHADYSQYDRQFAVWAAVDTEVDMEPRTFYIAGTGHDMEHKLAKEAVVEHLQSFCVVVAESNVTTYGWFHAFEVKR